MGCNTCEFLSRPPLGRTPCLCLVVLLCWRAGWVGWGAGQQGRMSHDMSGHCATPNCSQVVQAPRPAKGQGRMSDDMPGTLPAQTAANFPRHLARQVGADSSRHPARPSSLPRHFGGPTPAQGYG